jgi:hypothetical protein
MAEECSSVVALEIEKLERRLSQANGSSGGKGDLEAPTVDAAEYVDADAADSSSPGSVALFRRRNTFAAVGGMSITVQVRA